jgi:hypothetical protein
MTDTVVLNIQQTVSEILDDIRAKAAAGTLTQVDLAVGLEAQQRFIEYLDDLLDHMPAPSDVGANLDAIGNRVADLMEEVSKRK